jgi:hypothetical protein
LLHEAIASFGDAKFNDLGFVEFDRGDGLSV